MVSKKVFLHLYPTKQNKLQTLIFIQMNTTNKTFKKEFTQNDFKSIEKRICKFLKGRMNYTNQTPEADIFLKQGANTFKQMASVLGLAYTSSGVCAGLWICNVELYLDLKQVYKIKGFVKDSSGFCFAWCNDTNENELFINI